jgi:NAD(P)-dependent dehydrogenase (short-subunit alcohol dehydrogenase family)
LGQEGIRVNAVAPGPVPTNIYANAGMSQQQTDALLRDRRAETPLRRTATPEEVAGWICRLALADEGVTGQVISVDGGLSVT